MDGQRDSWSSQLRGYADSFVPPRPAIVAEMEKRAADDGFPIIGPACGWFCFTMARMIGARQVFEMGSGFGYSTYWFARAVRESGGGAVHHTVWDEKLSASARKSLDALGFGGTIKYHISEAIAALESEKGPFDLIFCDIDKHDYPRALLAAKEKIREGGLMIFDNMIWDGRIFDPDDSKDSTKGIRETARLAQSDPDLAVSLVPLRDGLLLAFKHGIHR